MRPSLHPQNDRIGDEGIGDAILEYLNYYQLPPKYLTDNDQTIHRTPLCPEIAGRVFYQICSEEAIYVGEEHCDTCVHYRTSGGDSWTDPRFRRGEQA